MTRRKSASAGQTVGVAAQRLVADRLALVRKRLRKAAKAPADQPEPVHQLRVATRRARAALELFAPVLEAKSSAWFLKRLRKLRRAAGDARNLDVYMARLKEQGIEVPEKVLPLLEHERQRAIEPVVELDKQLQGSKTWEKREKDLFAPATDKKVAKVAQQPLAKFAPAAVAPLAKDFIAGLDPADRSAAKLHQLRVAGKRLRYTLELVADALPKAKRGAAKPLEALQGVLGDLNDLATAAELVDELAKKSKKRSVRRWLKAQRKQERAAFSLARAKFLRGWSQAERQALEAKLQRIAGKKRPPKD
jgi:CHAD domain-containing protein